VSCARSDCTAPAEVHGVFEWAAVDGPSRLDTPLDLCRAHADEEAQLGALHRHFLWVARALCIALRRPEPVDTRLAWRAIP
jgi:hypothetical protein